MCGKSAVSFDSQVSYIHTTHESIIVPVSNLPQLVLETKEDLTKKNILFTIVGGFGDGTFHTAILFKTLNESVEEAVHALVERAIALQSTCTGAHGVGIGKKQYSRG